MNKKIEKNVWEEFFELKDTYKVPKNKTIKGITLPDEMIKWMRRHLIELEDRGIKTNYSELTTLALMVLFNLKQNENGFYLRKGDDHIRSMEHYLNLKDEKKEGE